MSEPAKEPAPADGIVDPRAAGAPMTPGSMCRLRSESTTSQLDSGGVLASSFSSIKPETLCAMLDYGVTSEQGTRKTMEDQHTALCGVSQPASPAAAEKHAHKNIPFFGVYDGHGGTHCAEFLKANLAGYVINHAEVKSDPQKALRESVLRCEAEFMEKCRVERIESGSTAAMAMIVNGKLYAANVGDSEIILSRGGQPKVLSTKHHLAANEKEVERVKAVGGRIWHNRVGHPKFNPQLVSLAVCRAIGDAGFKLEEYTDGKASGIIADPDTQECELLPQDEFLLIGCDGLFDVMDYAEVIGFCKEQLAVHTAAYADPAKREKMGGPPSKLVSEAIVNEALKRGSTDNVTVLFVNLKPMIDAVSKEKVVMGESVADGAAPPPPPAPPA